nr:hypothetical protein [Kribbella qitaiheensis]
MSTVCRPISTPPPTAPAITTTGRGHRQPPCGLLGSTGCSSDHRTWSRLGAHLAQGPLQQQIAIGRRTVQERLRRDLAEELLHLLQLDQLGPALGAAGQVLVDLADPVRLQRAQGIGAQL